MFTLGLSLILLSGRAPGFFPLREMAYQPLNTLKKFGNATVFPHDQSVEISGPGFRKIHVNKAGASMSRIVVDPRSLYDWKTLCRKCGIGVDHVSTKAIPVPPSPIPLFRNKLEVIGATGLPSNPNTHHSWKLVYSEFAVANPDRLRATKPRIQSAQGDEKMKLLRSCYDWFSELDLSAS